MNTGKIVREKQIRTLEMEKAARDKAFSENVRRVLLGICEGCNCKPCLGVIRPSLCSLFSA